MAISTVITCKPGSEVFFMNQKLPAAGIRRKSLVRHLYDCGEFPCYSWSVKRCGSSAKSSKKKTVFSLASLVKPIQVRILNFALPSGRSLNSRVEIAKIMECNVGTVRSRLFYARQQLQAILSDYLK